MRDPAETAVDGHRYDGERALVVGGATGIGAATARLVRDLGAEVVVLDVADCHHEGVEAIHVDLRHPGSIDEALDACGGPIDALFACAGVADGVDGIERINFLGHRHLIEQSLDLGFLGRGSAIAFVSSAASIGWAARLELLAEYLDTPDFDTGVSWIRDRPELATYLWSKQSINAYVAREAFRLLRQGVRINALLAGPTDTPMSRARGPLALTFGADYRTEAGIEAAVADDQASILAFLCSEAARAVTGSTLLADAGWSVSGYTGSFPPARPLVEALLEM